MYLAMIVLIFMIMDIMNRFRIKITTQVRLIFDTNFIIKWLKCVVFIICVQYVCMYVRCFSFCLISL